MKKILLRKEYIYQGNLILVNSKYELKEKAKKYNLTNFNNKFDNILLDYNCNLELQNALRQINAEDKIIPVSGYRSLEEQENLYNMSLKENGEIFTKKYISFPNCSEHQTGLAIDLGINKENIDFIRPEFPYYGISQEFRNIMSRYGFIERYTKGKESITKIANEEWHFRYVGYPHSYIMKKTEQCLEEYIEYLQKFEYGKSALVFENYEISYIKLNKDLIEIEIGDDEIVTISGNNIDGVIVTKKKI